MNFFAARPGRPALPTTAVRLALGVLLAVAVAQPGWVAADVPPPVGSGASTQPGAAVQTPVGLPALLADVLVAGPDAVELAPAGRDRGPERVHGPATATATVTAAAAPAGRPVTLPRSDPARVRIPSIGVDSDLVGLGLQDDGRMEVPPGAFPAGWYTGAPTPGELGPAVLAGHVDHGGAAGVFVRLRDLRPGDRVEVDRDDGSTVVFRVTHVEQHSKDAFPTAAVYGDIDHAGLRLITCGGSFDRRLGSYEDNVVVFAELVPGA